MIFGHLGYVGILTSGR